MIMQTIENGIYLSFEISTQQAKVIAIDDYLNTIYEDSLQFDLDLPEFKTENGVNYNTNGRTITANPLMWMKAIDILLNRMLLNSFNFAKIAALSGTAQQHGSIYWKTGSEAILKNLNSNLPLHQQFQDAFSIYESPIWMDCSTEEQCKRIEKHLGGPLKLCELTGSRAYHRLTGNQIFKIYDTKKKEYKETERISLVSSFGCSLFLGSYASIDECDGSGMNLMDLKGRIWSKDCIKAYGMIDEMKQKDFIRKLGIIVPPATFLGFISSYFSEKYNFPSNCKVIAFTGDNPASFAGMMAEEGDMIVSLGTSDTLMIWLSDYKICSDGMLFVNPLENKSYTAMLCFKNGSLVREKIKDNFGIDSWNDFENILASTEPGNDGNIGIYFDVTEITPSANGFLRFNKSKQLVEHFSREIEIRALIEGQFLAKKLYSLKIGWKFANSKRILATGGASKNKSILQILSDVFNLPVYVQDISNSACLGSAYRAKQGYHGGNVSFSEMFKAFPTKYLCSNTPNSHNTQIYESLMDQYTKLEEKLMAISNVQ